MESEETASSVENVLADLTNQASTAVGQHLARANSNTSKRKRAPQQSDAEKIESLYNSIDVLRETSSLAESGLAYLKAKKSQQNQSVLNPIITVLEYINQTNKDELKSIAKTANNTGAKKQAQQAHSKITKAARQEAASYAIQLQRLMQGNPVKTLQVALNKTKETVQSIKQPNSTAGAASSTKASESSASTDSMVARGAKNRKTNDSEVYQIRLPRPLNGALMYTPQGAVNIIWHNLLAPNVSPKPS